MKHCITALIVALALASAVVAPVGGCAPTPTPGEVAAWHDLLLADIAIVRAVVEKQPPGPNRDKWLAMLDQVESYNMLATAIAELAANHVRVTTRPTVTP